MTIPNVIDPFIKGQIEAIKNKCEKIKPLVVIRCITYNHGSYIKDALEGFLMQKSDFPFVAIVHDDVSTDNTAEIVKEYAEKYPNLILPIYEKENQYSKKDGSLKRIMNTACESIGAKYTALCEGDDYWTDPLKLQKQVNFLEANSEYGMCYGKVRVYNQERKQFSVRPFGNNKNSFEELICLSYPVPTCTILYRQEIYSEYINTVTTRWEMGDYPLALFFSLKSKIKFFDEIFGVYRILKNSASHFNNLKSALTFIESGYSVDIYFLNLSKKEELLPVINNNHNIGILRQAYQFHNYELANMIRTKCSSTNYRVRIMRFCARNKLFFTLYTTGYNLLRKLYHCMHGSFI